MSSSWDEHRRPNTLDRGTPVQTKWVKPMGVVQRVEPSSARDRRKSSARVSVLLSMNRRMRTRMSGGCATLNEPPDADPHVRWCERERLAAAPYSIMPLFPVDTTHTSKRAGKSLSPSTGQRGTKRLSFRQRFHR